MSDGWGPSYGDPTHPTTGELPTVGDGRHGTDEIRTVQIDVAAKPGRPRAGNGETGGNALVGDGGRGTVDGLTVQVDHVQDPGARRPGDTQLLPRIAPAPKGQRVPAADRRPAAPAPSGAMPVQRRQLGPDWTQMPLRLLAAAVVTLAVLGISAASLVSIASWINP